MTDLIRRILSPRNRPAWLVFSICLLLSWMTWRSLQEQAMNAAEHQFNLHVRDVEDAIKNRMIQHEQILLGGAGLFDAGNGLSRTEWRTYVERLKLGRNYPGIQGVGFSQVIAPARLQAHIATVRAEGFPQYTVRPPGERPLYTSIIYLEPFSDRNLAAFGFDMMSEPTRAKAMRLAAQTGETTITGKVKLVQETHGKTQAGFLMYVPVYQKQQPLVTDSGRWSALQGFVYSPYRVNDLMHGILGEQLGMLDLRIFDGSQETGEALLYTSTEDPSVEALLTGARLSAVRTLSVYGQTWTVRIQSRPGLVAGLSSSMNIAVLAMGGGISVLLFFLVSFLIFRRDQAEKLAVQMTGEISLEIAERKVQEHAAQEHAQQTQAILDNVVDGIITIDAGGMVQSMNRAAKAIFGYEEHEVMGRNINMLMPEPYHSQHDGYLKNYRDTGIPRIIGIGREVVGQRKDGNTFPMDLAVSRSVHQDEPLFIGLVRDITERKRVEQMKAEFVSTVSHELRTPLTSINGALGLVCGGALGAVTDQAKSMLDIAYKNSQRLTHLINDLLDMEKLAAGKVRFDMQAQELMPLVDQSVESTRAYAQPFQVNLVLTERAEGVRVRVDASRLQQVLSNFLSNAAKFSPQGGQVDVVVRQTQGVVRVEVVDHGPGIPAEFRGRVFQKFSQADSSDTRQKGGTGLGLAISKELMERMNGVVGFASQEGQGASFYFELPVLAESLPVSEVATGDVSGGTRLLVVEDDPDIARLLVLILSGAGYSADVAGTVEQALKLLDERSYAAMTLDLQLPDASGVSLIRLLRGRAEFETFPIFVVSAAVDDGKLEINGDFAAVDWIDKPIDEMRLIAAVQRCLPVKSPGKVKILHVEDDPDLHQVVSVLGRDAAEFDIAYTLEIAREKLAHAHYDLVILDIGLPDGSGWSLLPDINALRPVPRVIILSGSEVSAEQQLTVHQAFVKSRTLPQNLIETIRQGIAYPTATSRKHQP